jgi:hypothetical protein
MFAGMDLHKNYLQLAVLDGKGKVLKNSRIHNDLSKVGRFFDRIGNSSNVKVVMELSYVWYNICYASQYPIHSLVENHPID